MVSARQKIGDWIGSVKDVFTPEVKPQDVPTLPPHQRTTTGGIVPTTPKPGGGGGARPIPVLRPPRPLPDPTPSRRIEAEKQAQELKEQRERQQARDLRLASERLAKEREAIRVRQKKEQIEKGIDVPLTQSEKDVLKQEKFLREKKLIPEKGAFISKEKVSELEIKLETLKAEGKGKGAEAKEIKAVLRRVEGTVEFQEPTPSTEIKETIAKEVSKPTILGIGPIGLKGKVLPEVLSKKQAGVTVEAFDFLTTPATKTAADPLFKEGTFRGPLQTGKTVVFGTIGALAKQTGRLEDTLVKSEKLGAIQDVTAPVVLGAGPVGLKGEGIRAETVVGAGAKVIKVAETPAGLFFITQFPKAPKLIRIAGGGAITGALAAQTVKDLGDIHETRKGVLLTGLAGAGTVFETIPFIRGLKTKTIGRVTGKFKKVKTQPEGFKAVSGKKIVVKRLIGRTGKGELVQRIEAEKLPFKIPREERIGLIQPSDIVAKGKTAQVKLPEASPLRSGRNVLFPSTKKLFIGKKQQLATSQIGLVKTGETLVLKRELFLTQQEPFLKIPETRVTRLGIENLLTPPKTVKIGFGVPKKPQILLTTADVGVKETTTGTVIGKGPELETLKTFGTITDVVKTGETTIKGQGVDIFTFRFAKGPKTGVVKDGASTEGVGRVSGELLLGAAGVSKTVTTPTRTFTTTTILQTKTFPPLSKSISKPTRTISKPTTISLLTTTKTTKPTKITVPLSSLTTPTPSRPTRVISQPTIIKTPPIPPPRFRGRAPTRPRRGLFLVRERRFGKFRPIGKARTLKQAITIGALKTQKSLGQTFDITRLQRGGKREKARTPKGFKQIRKLGKKKPRFLTFREKPKARINLPSEITGLARARRRKKNVRRSK